MSVMLEDKIKYHESLFFNNISQLVLCQKNEFLKKAIFLFLSKNYNDSQDYLLATYPEYSLNEDTNALLLMGHIQLKLNQLDSAIDYFRQSLKMMESPNFFISDSLSIIYFYKNDYDLAIRYIEEAPSFPENNFYFHFHLGLYHEAILNKSLEGNKRNYKDTIDKEKKKQIEELYKKIKEHYNTALKLNPNSYNTLLNLGSINASEGYFAFAENFYKKALKINEKDWKINFNLACLYMKEKEYDISLEFFEKTIEILGEKVDIKILYPYMICLRFVGLWDKLEKISKKILKINRKSKRALVYLIEALENKKDYKQLLDLLNKIKNKMKSIKTIKTLKKKEIGKLISQHYDSVKKKLCKK